MKSFVGLVKRMNQKLYRRSICNAAGKSIIIFNANLDLDLNRLRQMFTTEGMYYLCLPDKNIEKSIIPNNVEVIKLSDIQGFVAENNSVIFIPQDYINWLFWPIVKKNANSALINCIGNVDFYDQVFTEILNHIDEIYEVFSLLDEVSKDYYMGSLVNKVSGDISDLKFAESEQYFLSGFLPQKNDIAIDAGAYDGMTGKILTQMGCEVYSFELDRLNYQLGLVVAEKNDFVLENMGLGELKKKIRYNSANAASSISDTGMLEGEITDLDSYLEEKGLSKVDFIKMDIEGAELSALKGCVNTISRYKPKMAICMYHKLEDMWEIPRYIKEIRSDYEFSFRQHYTPLQFSDEILELLGRYNINPLHIPCHAETVLYCR